MYTLALVLEKVIESLVGGFNSSEKYSSIWMIVPNICENKKCSKPPTSISYYLPMYTLALVLEKVRESPRNQPPRYLFTPLLVVVQLNFRGQPPLHESTAPPGTLRHFIGFYGG